MNILLIRHGKTKGNLEGRYVGITDEPLLETEKEILEKSPLRCYHPDLIFTSGMRRCTQTARILFQNSAAGMAGLRVHSGLRETDFGAFEYKNYEELNGDPVYQAWIDSGGMTAFPGGESGEEFRARCRMAFEECVREAAGEKAQNVAFVVHGGTIMSVMEAYALPHAGFYSWQVKNGGGYMAKLAYPEENGSPLCLTGWEKMNLPGRADGKE